MTDRQRLLELLREQSLEFGDFVLSSGGRSHYYVDCRRTTMHAEGQVLVGRLMLELIRDLDLQVDAVGGLTMGADPIAYAVAYTSFLEGMPLHAFSVRKQAKVHGTGRRIEGCMKDGDRVIVVEDAVSTGGSALDACAAVEAAGGTVAAVVGLVDRESGGIAAIEAAGYQVVSLFRISELLAQNSPVTG